MKVSNIKCNGIGPTALAKASMPTIQTAVSLFRMRYTNDEILEKMPINHNYYFGTRFNDNNAITIRICSALVSESKIELRSADPDLIEGYIKTFIDSLKGSEMDELIIDGMRDCAGADHWYTFEKEWE
jgi:hypothetical protein